MGRISSQAYDLSQLKIMVVDDCQFMRRVLERMLKALGVGDVVVAKDGNAALFQLACAVQDRDGPPDLIVTDWEMEPMNGHQFVNSIRDSDQAFVREMPVIMLTGHSDLQTVKAARDFGVSEFLTKPVSAERLYQRITSIIDHPRPFIQSDQFSGPCRRRQNRGFSGEDRRGGDFFML